MVSAQNSLNLSSEFGETQASFGNTIKMAVDFQYDLGNFNIKTGLQADIKDYLYNTLSAYTAQISHSLKINRFNFNANVFYLHSAKGQLFNEYNYGFSFSSLNTAHFDWEFGTHFRIISPSRYGVNTFQLSRNSVYENWNFIYVIKYRLKPVQNCWNLSFCMTNRDLFYINQETNPYCYLGSTFRISSRLSSFTEVWYKPAGMSNFRVNYFGYLIRTGIKWNLSKL